jgi:hypothetical protein
MKKVNMNWIKDPFFELMDMMKFSLTFIVLPQACSRAHPLGIC